MQRLMTCSLVAVLSLAVAGVARADGHPPGHSRGGSMSRSGNYHTYSGNHYQNYHQTHGVSFKYGYYYKGKGHHHWSQSYWSPRYGCTIYWCPATSCWYYWCQPYDCYYPVSYCPTGTYAY
jgi:hypothetical protein